MSEPDLKKVVEDLHVIVGTQETELRAYRDAIDGLRARIRKLEAPIPMRLNCPFCGALHVDEGEFEKKVHHTHACQGCGGVWRPAIVPTVGVRFLPGFKNDHYEEEA